MREEEGMKITKIYLKFPKQKQKWAHEWHKINKEITVSLNSSSKAACSSGKRNQFISSTFLWARV